MQWGKWENSREHFSEWSPQEPLAAPDSNTEPVIANQESLAAESRIGVEKSSQDGRADRELRLLGWSVGASVILHSALLLMVFDFIPGDGRTSDSLVHESDELQTIAVRLLMQNPLRALAEEAVEANEGEANEREASERAAEESEAGIAIDALQQELIEARDELYALEPAKDLSVPPDESSGPEETSPPPELPQNDSRAVPGQSGFIAPSVAMMRESIQAVDSQVRGQSWRRLCTPLQEESELLDCAETAEPDYSAATVNASYRALNPTFTQSRSQRSIPVIAGEYSELSEQLDALVERGELPAWLGDHALQQIDRNISDESGSSNRVVDHMIQMTDKSEAAQRARIMFGDAWLRNTIEEAVRRNVHIE